MNKKTALQRSGLPAIDVLEEAVRLLRSAPASTLLLHWIGSVPCLLGALYFLADMGHSAFASGRLFGASLALAALYLWMKCWQTIFSARLRAVLLLEAPPRWTPARLARLAAVQCALHPAGLVLRFAAMVVALPYVWTATFFQNVTVLGDGGCGFRELCARAWAQARLWPKQAHALAALLTVFGFFVWVNVTAGMVALPALLKMFFGVETVFSRHLAGFLNPTFFAATLAGMYLCLDPLRKAAVVLRCFHGSSLRSGADLEVQLRGLLARAALIAVLCFSPVAHAELAPPRVEPQELSRSIDEVLEHREFAWRAPRGVKDLPKAQETWLQRWRREFGEQLERWTWKIGRTISRWMRKLDEWLSGKTSGDSSRFDLLSWLGSVRFIVWLLLGIALVLLAVLIVRSRRSRSRAVVAEAVAPRPDLTREDVTADQLPEDGWLQLARELMDRGELRLALRASYLAALAHLGQRELIRLAKHKSNRDYDRELRRRARALPEVVGAFDRSLLTFERSWYGEHEVTRDVLGDFARHLEKIRAC